MPNIWYLEEANPSLSEEIQQEPQSKLALLPQCYFTLTFNSHTTY